MADIKASSHTNSPKRRLRSRPATQENDSLGAMFRKGIVNHQLGLSINLLLLLGLTYAFFPSLRKNLEAFFYMSYKTNTLEGMYGQGPRDLYLVASFVVIFTGVRALALDYILLPLAGICGVTSKKSRVRFAEQSYMMIYYATYWTWGLILFIRDTPADVHDTESLLVSLWTGFPKLHISFGMKLYYLSQFAFWLQQLVVIHIEEMRKDHLQMLAHHIITISLLAGSYPYRQWRVGNAVLVCMDFVDFVFPLAKILRYMALQTACDFAFGVFVISWLITRHAFYLAICWSIWAHVHEVTMHYGVYSLQTGARISNDGGNEIVKHLFQPMLNPSALTFNFNANIRFLFLGMLLALQCITIAWFVMICRVVMRVIRGQGADDTRSDDEGEEYDTETLGDAMSSPIDADKSRFIEIEASSEDSSYHRRRESSSSSSTTTANSSSTNASLRRKSKGISSGLNLNGHKEILNRIGCLSEEQLARERERLEDTQARANGAGQKH